MPPSLARRDAWRYVAAFLLLTGLGVWAQPRPPASGTTNRANVVVSKDKAAATRLFDSWKPAMPPRRLIGNIYYVGMKGVSSFLITTSEGHILIDTCFTDSVSQIRRNIQQLGFRESDIKVLLSSHAHADHVGGHLEMKLCSGNNAQIVASAADGRLMKSGGAEDFSPFPKELMSYPPVMLDRVVKDGDTVTLGGVTLTAHLTPGHTKGATTWTMPLKEGDRTYHVVFFSSTTIVAPTRLVNNPDYPEIAEDYAATFKKLKALPCDVFFAPHAEQFGLASKLERLEPGAGVNPFIDPAGWQRLISDAESAYQRQLTAEKENRQP